MLRSTLTIAALILAGPTTAAVKAPAVNGTFEQLAKPLPLPYDEAADADARIAAARARAVRKHKRLLIDLGGNWCLDCRLLAGTMELPTLRAFVARHYEVVTVDIGRFDKNGQVYAGYGGKDRLAGVPALLIVEPRTNRLLNKGHETALSDARSMSPQGLADYLARLGGMIEAVAPEPGWLASPCVNICMMDTHTDWCLGCGRTIGEISNWSARPAEERRAILQALPARMATLRDQLAG